MIRRTGKIGGRAIELGPGQKTTDPLFRQRRTVQAKGKRRKWKGGRIVWQQVPLRYFCLSKIASSNFVFAFQSRLQSSSGCTMNRNVDR